ncbi:MAG: class I SAM-dependent methyltransferase [Chloroflexi bacterium]|nr:MAG: class I SAM-dependent methyltransferase [Chloroflexota bacterium]MBL1193699.1 class I SAM-dependent methyltransferase [Chloroflexota bacterium]NOH10992.1 methyltransferase domain-containing protein [Chloroflexota bacterium]
MQLSKEILACPTSRQSLENVSDNELSTADRQYSYKCLDGIWRFLPPDRANHFKQFIKEYEAVRKAEGRGERDKDYYRALPYEDISGKRPEDWRIRAASLDTLLEQVLEPSEQKLSPMTILDIGAGNGWLSHQLAKRGHALGAVDLLVNDWDGLGAQKYYDVDFTRMQAEFDHLPIKDKQIDILIYNAALHYSEHYGVTLTEGLRCLKTDGILVVMDSPIYMDGESGWQMVQEREEAFQQKHGFPSNAINSENYLTYGRVDSLGEKLGIRWRRITPDFGLGWKLRPLKAGILMRREPAKFELLIGHKSQ